MPLRYTLKNMYMNLKCSNSYTERQGRKQTKDYVLYIDTKHVWIYNCLDKGGFTQTI